MGVASGMASCLDLGRLGGAGAQQAAGPAETTVLSCTDHHYSCLINFLAIADLDHI